MFDKKSTEKIAEIFFKEPRQKYHLREIARKAKISASTATQAVDELEKRNLVKVEKGATKEIEANKNENFKDLKRIYNLKKLVESGLIDKLEKEYRPDTLVLFGSYSNGEDDSTSDIDIAVVNGKENEINLTEFEKELDRKIKIQEINIDETGENFRSTLGNGIVLRGYLDL